MGRVIEKKSEVCVIYHRKQGKSILRRRSDRQYWMVVRNQAQWGLKNCSFNSDVRSLVTKLQRAFLVEFLWLLILFSLQINEPLSLAVNKPIALLINELTKNFSIKQVWKAEGRRQMREGRKMCCGDILGSMLKMQITCIQLPKIFMQQV